MPVHRTVALFLMMLLARLTEGIGLVLLVPMLDVLAGNDGTPAAASQVSRGLASISIKPEVGPLLLVFVGLVTFRGLLTYGQQMISVLYQYGLVDNFRKRLFGRLLNAEWRWLADQRNTDLSNHLLMGVARIGMGFNQMVDLLSGVCTMLAYGVTCFILSWKITLVALVAGVFVHALFGPLRKRATDLGYAVGDANRNLQSKTEEGLAAIRLTKLERAEERHLASFSESVNALRHRNIAFFRSSGRGDMALQVGGAVALAGILFVGIAWLKEPFSVLLTTVLVLSRLLPTFAATQRGYNIWLHMRPAVEEFDTLLAQSIAAAEPARIPAQTALPLTDALVLENLSFTYNGRAEPVLNNVSLRINANSFTAIKGASGAGKSTLADLITGLIEPDSGAITVDGVPLTGTNRRRWRDSIAYVQQSGFLFHDSIRANLLWGAPQASDADIETALRKAAADFVLDLPEGLNTIVGDGGQKLSGGERQRLALARTLLSKPSLLILDEATSALDLDNEAFIHQSLNALRGTMTIIIIGHRHRFLDEADQILTVRAGNVVHVGSASSD